MIVLSPTPYSIYSISRHTHLRYIGITENPDRRWKQHKRRSRSSEKPLYREMREFGTDSYTFEVFGQNLTLEEARDTERILIAHYRDELLNLCAGGHKNIEHAELKQRRKAAALKSWDQNHPRRKACGDRTRALWKTEEFKSAQRERLNRTPGGTMTTLWKSPEFRAQHRTRMLGNKLPAKCTPHDVRKIRELRKGGMMLKDIAVQFGLTVSGVYSICARRVWKEVL